MQHWRGKEQLMAELRAVVCKGLHSMPAGMCL